MIEAKDCPNCKNIVTLDKTVAIETSIGYSQLCECKHPVFFLKTRYESLKQRQEKERKEQNDKIIRTWRLKNKKK